MAAPGQGAHTPVRPPLQPQMPPPVHRPEAPFGTPPPGPGWAPMRHAPAAPPGSYPYGNMGAPPPAHPRPPPMALPHAPPHALPGQPGAPGPAATRPPPPRPPLGAMPPGGPPPPVPRPPFHGMPGGPYPPYPAMHAGASPSPLPRGGPPAVAARPGPQAAPYPGAFAPAPGPAAPWPASAPTYSADPQQGPADAKKLARQPQITAEPDTVTSQAAKKKEQDVAEAAKAQQDRNQASGASSAGVWTSHKAANGAVYYFNAVTKESTWTKPAGFVAEPADITEAPVPAFSDSVGNTPWTQVTCVDGRKYFSNAQTGVTTWDVPEEIAALVGPAKQLTKEQVAILERLRAVGAGGASLRTIAAPAAAMAAAPAPQSAALRPAPAPQQQPAQAQPQPHLAAWHTQPQNANTAGSVPPAPRPPQAAHHPLLPQEYAQARPAAAPQAPPAMPHGMGPLQHQGQHGGPLPPAAPTAPGPVRAAGPAGMPLGAMPGAAWAGAHPPGMRPPFAMPVPMWSNGRPFFMHPRPPAAPPAESLKQIAERGFKELLAEKNVHEFSRWEKEVPKLESDPRFKAVPAKERKALFDAFCRNVVEERQKLEEDRQKRQRAGLEELLQELLSVSVMQWHAFQEGKSVEEVEQLVAERLRAAEASAEECKAKPEELEEGEEGEEVAEEAAPDEAGPRAPELDPDLQVGGLITATTELADLDALVGRDPRWLESNESLREQVFSDVIMPIKQRLVEEQAAQVAEHQAAVHALLQRRGVTAESEWDAVGGKLLSAARQVPAAIFRVIFDAYVANLQSREEQKSKEAKASEARIAEAQRRKETVDQEAEKRRLRASKADAVQAFRTLLAEQVKDPMLSWSTCGGSEGRLARDPLGRGTSALMTDAEREAMFEEHVTALLQQHRSAYIAALTAVVLPDMSLPEGGLRPPQQWGESARDWEAAQEQLAVYPCFGKLPEKQRESTWRQFIADVKMGVLNPGAMAPAQLKATLGDAQERRAGPSAPYAPARDEDDALRAREPTTNASRGPASRRASGPDHGRDRRHDASYEREHRLGRRDERRDMDPRRRMGGDRRWDDQHDERSAPRDSGSRARPGDEGWGRERERDRDDRKRPRH